jgi:hypothetical protein
MHETTIFYVTLRFTLYFIKTFGVKNAKRFDKIWRFPLILRLIFRMIDGRLRYCTLKNSDEKGLPIVKK